MNRRNFLKFLSAATVGSTVAYSFPSVIVAKNIEDYASQINLITKKEIYPKLIEDFWFKESPFMSKMRELSMRISDSPEYGFGYIEKSGIWVHEVRKSESKEDLLEKDIWN